MRVYTHTQSVVASGGLLRERTPCRDERPGVRWHPGYASEPWERVGSGQGRQTQTSAGAAVAARAVAARVAARVASRETVAVARAAGETGVAKAGS